MEKNYKHSTTITAKFHNYQDNVLILPLRMFLFSP